MLLAQGTNGTKYAVKYLKTTDHHASTKALLREAAFQDNVGRLQVSPQFDGFSFLEPSKTYHDVVLVTRFLAFTAGSNKSITLGSVLNGDRSRREDCDKPLLSDSVYEEMLLHINHQIQCLGKAGIVHADLKKDNILLQMNPNRALLTTSIIDYGLSFRMSGEDRRKCSFKTGEESEEFLKKYPQYAPELVYKDMHCYAKTDLYSYGRIV